MEFLDLKAQYRSIRKPVNRAIRNVLESSHFILGSDVPALEREIAAFLNVRYAVGVNSGTDALYGSMKALGVGPGDEVVVPAFTFFATAEIVSLAGARPVFVDIDPKTFNLDPKKIPAAITKRTRAIVPVHLFGQPADMDPIMRIARQHNLFVVEDAAQAIGAMYHSRSVGTIGDLGCISFFPTKNLGGYGDGGMVVTNRKRLYTFLSMWHVHGSREKYRSEFTGACSRLDSLQAATLRVKLRRLKRWNAIRAQKAKTYDRLLKETGVITPFRSPRMTHVFHQYTIRVPQRREMLKAYLASKGIPTMVYYPLPLHLQPAFQRSGYRRGDFPESERASTEVLSLPLYPELSLSSQKIIVHHIKSFIQ